jgi:hypothetical protein
MGGVLGPDSILDPVPRVGGTTIKGKHSNVVILKDRDDDDIGKHFWAMSRCLQTFAATNMSNMSFPSTHASHKHGHKCIYPSSKNI